MAPGVAPRASAWPAETITGLSRDAPQLLPRSPHRPLGERDTEGLDEAQRLPPDIARALALDLPTGKLRPETIQALQSQADAALSFLKQGQATEGLIRLGGLLRIAADLSDPVLAVGPE